MAGLYERDGEPIYNTAVLLDREGKLAGKYRKIHLPREEWKKGVTPGPRVPGVQDRFRHGGHPDLLRLVLPRGRRRSSASRGPRSSSPRPGARRLPDQDGRVDGENVFRVRARDNGIYLVPSVYDGSSMVIDPLGRILASNKGREGVFWCEVDLNAREPLWWVGHWRAHRPADPHAGDLSAAPRRPGQTDLLSFPIKTVRNRSQAAPATVPYPRPALPPRPARLPTHGGRVMLAIR